MGVVYTALDPRLKRQVAIKLLTPDLTRDETAKQRFLQEAQVASALDHPNICTIHEINETADGQLYLVMAHFGYRDPSCDELHLRATQGSLGRARIAHLHIREVVHRAQVVQGPHLVRDKAHRADHVAGPAGRPEVGLGRARVVGRHHRDPRLVGTGARRAVAGRLPWERCWERVLPHPDTAAEPVDADQGDERADDLDQESQRAFQCIVFCLGCHYLKSATSLGQPGGGTSARRARPRQDDDGAVSDRHPSRTPRCHAIPDVSRSARSGGSERLSGTRALSGPRVGRHPHALTRDDTAKQRFLQEAQAASALDLQHRCSDPVTVRRHAAEDLRAPVPDG